MPRYTIIPPPPSVDEGREREWQEECERVRKVIARRLYNRFPGATQPINEPSEAFAFCMAIAQEIEAATRSL